MDCNKTSWDEYSEDSFEEESKQNESPLIFEAKKKSISSQIQFLPFRSKNIYII